MNQDEQIETLLDRWEEAKENGTPLTVEELCADFPLLLPELKRQIKIFEKMEGPLEAVTVSSPQRENEKEGNEKVSSKSGPPQRFEEETLTTRQQYQDVVFHARGGLGSVYRAEDAELHREVALKFLHRQYEKNEEIRSRFTVEAEITSRLHHPGVVPVHGSGVSSNGRPFYAMQFIEGESLESAIRRFHHPTEERPTEETRLEFHNLLSRFVDVCQTLAYAHNCGIVHRDIKPDNIMLGRFGETLVVDWGLAIQVGRDDRARASGERTLVIKGESQTSSNTGVGTPAYMSPEQHSQASKIYPKSDIYSLGVTLYKLLTGKTPFSAESFSELKKKVFQGEYAQPRQVNSAVPHALEAVCLKAMSVSAGERYETALELAEEVTRYLDDVPVLAMQESMNGKISRWMRRHRAASVVGLFAAALFCIVMFSSAVWFNQIAEKERGSRLSAEEAELGNLKLSSQFAARMIASEIDQRWRILEMEANSTILKTQLRLINANPEDKTLYKPLQQWITQRFVKHNEALSAKSWFIDSVTGIQVSRSPYSARSVGKSWRFRNYFHGQGRDLEPEEAEENQVPPIEETTLSGAFRSRATNTLMVTFTVPIWSDEIGNPARKVIGVLGLSVELGNFKSLEGGSVLVDTREDWVEKRARRGRILHHPKIDQSSSNQGDEVVPRLGSPLLETLLEFQDRVMKRVISSALPPTILTTKYVSPFETSGPLQQAACTPVIIEGRPARIKRTGWVVIVPQNVVHKKRALN